MDYLPSKNFVKIVGSIITILLVGWLVLFIWDKGKDSAGKTLGFDKEKLSVEEAEKEANKDTDNDGLKDWEEQLWKTDLNQIDSDADGTSDGDEVKFGRNPKIAGACTKKSDSQVECSDKLQSPEEMSKNKNSDEPGTFTAKIAQEFGKNYFAGKGLVGGESLSAQAQQSLANSITLGIEQGVAAYQDIFKKEDIKVSKFLSPKIYVDKLGNAFRKNFSAVGGFASGGKNVSELDIINLVISEKHFENVKLFDPLVSAYKNMVLFLQKETAPESYADLHLTVLNIMQNALFAARSMKNIEEDPAKAIVGIRLYTQETERTAKFLKNLKTQIEKDAIKFSEQDGGNFFSKYFENI